MSLSRHVYLAAVSGLLFSSLSLQFYPCPREEISTECICWCLILCGGKLFLRFVLNSSRPFNPSEFSTIAFGATLLCLSNSVQKTTWSMAPLLGPALALNENRSAILPEHERLAGKEAGVKFTRRRDFIFLGLYACIAMFALFQDDPLHGLHLKLCWLFAQTVLYWALIQRVSQAKSIQEKGIEEAFHTATGLASVMVAVTGPLVVLFWYGAPSIPKVGVVSALKAIRWTAILVLAHGLKLSIAAWTTIFAICTTAVWEYPQGFQTGLTLVVALITLYPIVTKFPKSSIGKWILLAFGVCPLWAFGIRSGLGSYASGRLFLTEPTRTQSAIWTSPHHPIFHLAEEAKARFEKTLQRQSQSLIEAVAEYKRRYGRPPPLGFDKWYKFATENDVQFIDEYDFMTTSFDAFWRLPPHILRDYVDQALALPDMRLNTLTVKNGEASLSDGSFQHRQLVELLTPIVHLLPDLKAALNEPDEPRVLPPYDTLHNPPTHPIEYSKAEGQPVYFAEQNRQIIWNSVTLPCEPDSRARSAVIQPENNNHFPPFILNLTQAQDICLWPASASRKHGFLASPSTFHYTHNLVPILATAKLSPFRDIMIPSSYYFQGDIAHYDESKDIPYSEKKDVVYWRGTGTGGHWTHDSWRMGHRQRFVNFTNSASSPIQLMEQTHPRSSSWTSIPSTMSSMLSKFRVHFSNFIQCDAEDCTAQEKYFGKADSDSNDDAHAYKILYNLDGNSFSGRYYRFLKGNSLVFMQALFKEWHDDRILPWVHFVPISVGMEELPETTRYLLDDNEGKLVAERIASESRVWARRVLREVDLTAAYYRAFLEYARLVSDERDGMGCCS